MGTTFMLAVACVGAPAPPCDAGLTSPESLTRDYLVRYIERRTGRVPPPAWREALRRRIWDQTFVAPAGTMHLPFPEGDTFRVRFRWDRAPRKGITIQIEDEPEVHLQQCELARAGENSDVL